MDHSVAIVLSVNSFCSLLYSQNFDCMSRIQSGTKYLFKHDVTEFKTIKSTDRIDCLSTPSWHSSERIESGQHVSL